MSLRSGRWKWPFEQRRLQALGKAITDESHQDCRHDDEGKTRVPAAARDRADIEKAQHLQRVDHLRHVEPETEQPARNGGGRDIAQRIVVFGHHTTPVTATVIMATEKKTATRDG